MTLPARSACAVFLALFVTGPAFADGEEVAYKALMATVRAHKIVPAFDEASFAGAVTIYPASEAGGIYRVRPGRYMMWKIVHLFTSSQTATKIALRHFEERCIARKKGYVFRVECTLRATLLVRAGGRSLSIEITEKGDTGGYYPPKPGRDPAVIHSLVVPPVDAAVRRIRARLIAAGIVSVN
ncbi:MAG: hypothetical protein ACTSUD_03445 [Alphaproteobacteria bacterium]